MPTFTIPSNDHSITPSLAIEMTSRYRANKDAILNSSYTNQDILALSDTMNKEALRDLMDDTNCKAFRIYYGMDADLKIKPIIVGVNEDNEDMLPPPDSLSEVIYTIADDTQRCPPICPPSSYLNED